MPELSVESEVDAGTPPPPSNCYSMRTSPPRVAEILRTEDRLDAVHIRDRGLLEATDPEALGLLARRLCTHYCPMGPEHVETAQREVRSMGFACACWACLLGCGRVTSDDGLRTNARPDGSVVLHGDAAPLSDGSVVLHPDAAPLSDGSPVPRSDAPACTNGCLFGATVCTPDGLGVQRCELQATGCTAWGPVSACSAHESCQQSDTPYGTSALCICDTSTCMMASAFCDGQGGLVACAVDDHGCFYEASCEVGTPLDAVCLPVCDSCLSDAATIPSCTGMAPDAGCSCPGWSICQPCGP
jgi:hypothetical protein